MLRLLVRSVSVLALAGIVLALNFAVAAAHTSSARPRHIVELQILASELSPAHGVTKQARMPIACGAGSRRQCDAVVTFTVSLVDNRNGGGPRPAASGSYGNCIYPPCYGTTSVRFDWTGLVSQYHAYLAAEDGYNPYSYSAWNVWRNYTCSDGGSGGCVWPPANGSFWDPQRGANTDWDNQRYGDGETVWLRIWVDPSGNWTTWAGSTI